VPALKVSVGSGEDRLTLAREIEQVPPLIDVSREDRIARHPVGEFRMVERRIRMDRAQDSGMQFRLHSRFDGVGDHKIRFAFDQRIEDRGIVAPQDDRRFLKMSPVEALVGSPRIDDHVHAGLIDRRDRAKFRFVAAMRDRRLAT
jgi:hypothetical protein